MILATPHAVENRRLELRTKFLVDVLVEGDDFPRAVRVLNEQFNFLLGKQKAQVDYVKRRVSVHLQNFVARAEFKLRRQTARVDPCD